METDLFEHINPRYLSGITGEPKQLLQPISGYAHEPLTSLEEACEPLLSIVPRLQAHVWIAKQNSKNPTDGLTQDESASIRLYTMEWDASADEPRASLYAHLNQTLTQIDRTKLWPWFRYLKLFLTALAKLPPAPRQTVWRGVRNDYSDDYSPGKEATWWAFSSCTTSLSVLESDLYLGSVGTRTLFSIEAFNGRLIRAHSHFTTEDEILLLPGTFFIVKSRLNPAPGLHIVHLQQKIPPYDLLEPPFEGAQFLQSAEDYPSTDSIFDIEINIYKNPWYKRKRFYFGMALTVIIIILIILLAAILGTRNKSTGSSTSTITAISIFNYNISTYSPVSVCYAFYSFDRNVFDLYSKHDGTINRSPRDYIQGYVGYGQAIVLNQSISTSISVANSFDLDNQDFTFEAFILLYKNSINANLIQFSSGIELNIVDNYLKMILNKNQLISSSLIIPMNEWHHIAIVYNLEQQYTNIYIDGILNNQLGYRIPTNSENQNTTMIIGFNYEGAIDQLSISFEAKTTQRIQWDATVVAYYPLEEQTIGLSFDNGPNFFNATTVGIQSVSGVVRNAFNFNILNSYFQASGFTVLNIPQHAFTIALWVQPSMNPGIFLTIANSLSCLLVLGLRSSDNHLIAYLPNAINASTGVSLIGSEMIINRWAHITFTWSDKNQAQLYKDTILQDSNNNAIKLNNGFGNPMTLTLGTYNNTVNCTGGNGLDSIEQFTGSLDEVYIFSKELKQNEIKTLIPTMN